MARELKCYKRKEQPSPGGPLKGRTDFSIKKKKLLKGGPQQWGQVRMDEMQEVRHVKKDFKRTSPVAGGN